MQQCVVVDQWWIFIVVGNDYQSRVERHMNTLKIVREHATNRAWWRQS